MSAPYVYKKYEISSDPESVISRLSASLLDAGYVSIGESENTHYFKYPSIRFSSTKPLTCVSRLSFDVRGYKGESQVKIGATFTKIKYFTIAVMSLFCLIIPMILGYLKYGIPDIPPMSYLGVPIGFMLHYHVRWRAFTAIGRLVRTIDVVKK